MLDDFVLLPLAQDPADVLAGNIGQGSQVLLANLMVDEQLPRRGCRLPQVLGKLKQGACDAGLERQKAGSSHLIIRLPQALDQDGEELPVNLRMLTQTFTEHAAGRKVNLLSLIA
jgi:hypothetical protein